MEIQYSAPWSTQLKVMTAVVFVALAVAVPWTGSTIRLIIGGAVVMSASLMVRGYSVRDGKLLIHRLAWTKSLDLTTLFGLRPTRLRWQARSECSESGAS